LDQVDATTVVDAVYGNLTQDAPWSDGLELLRVALNSNVACLRISTKGPQPGQYLHAAGPKVSPYSLSEWETNSARCLLPVPLHPGEPRVLNCSQMGSANPIPQMLQRYDITHVASLLIGTDSEVDYILSANRAGCMKSYDADDLAFLCMVGGHFSRALKLRQELVRSRAVNEFQSDALDRLGVASLLVRPSGQVTVLNESAHRMVINSEWVRISGGKLRAVDERDDRLFQSFLREGFAPNGGRPSRAMRIRHGGKGPQLNVVVTRRRSASLISGRDETCILVFIGRANAADDSDLEVLQELFAFTPAEARVALRLARGMALEEVESELNIKHNTARAHLRSMYMKTDLSRQSELISLLANSLFPLGSARQIVPARAVS
jgi:DNA-binding CsgD family transcriptional regulator